MTEHRMVPTGHGMVEEPTEPGTHRITLEAGQTIRNPASTKHLIWGPCVLDWTIHSPSRAITVTIISGRGW